MKRLIGHASIISALLVIAAIPLFAGEVPVTPYGGYCKDCAVYGSCRVPVSREEAMHSLRKFYEERGYRLGDVQHRGRFVEAAIYLNDRQVDKVIFDRKTGRVRSMY